MRFLHSEHRGLAFAFVGAFVVVAGLGGCAASRDHAEGMKLIAGGEREKGLAQLAAASRADPGSAQYRLDYLQQQALAVRDAVARGDEARVGGQLDAARQWYRTALRIDAGSDRALRGLAAVDMEERHQAALAEADKLINGGDLAAARELLHTVLLENPANKAAQQLALRVAEKIEAADAARTAKLAASSVMRRPVSLQFRDANLRLVFEALSRTTGLNVIFDRDVRPELKTTIFVRDASVEDTVDMILLQSQLDKKVLNANTLFIYPSTAAKQKEYQDLKVRVFQLSNTDGKYVQTLLKTVLKAADMTLDEHSNTLVVRGTPDMIAVAEKLVAANDLPDPEVMLEVEVLEVSRDRLTDLGIQWPSSATVATPITVTTLSNLNHLPLNQLTVSGLSASASLQLQDTNSNILASPRIRVRDKEKAKILIGDKVPVITNSVTPVSTGSPVVTGSIQYLDVGIKLEVEPHVYMEGDVGIKLSIEVSNIAKEIRNDTSGSLAYQIGTRSAQTSLRLRDGETQILGGLISDQERSTSNKVPGLGQLPVLGKLFGADSTDHTKSEIVLSITPHILRAPAVADRRVRDVFSGTESAVRENPLRLDPVGSVSNTQDNRPVEPGFVGGGGGGPAPGAAPGVGAGGAAPVGPGGVTLPPNLMPKTNQELQLPEGTRADPQLPPGINTILRTPRVVSQQPGRYVAPPTAPAPGDGTAPPETPPAGN